MSSRCTARWDSPTGDPSSGGKELGGHGGSTGGGHCKMSRSRSTALQPHTSTAPHIRSPTDPQPGCALLPFQLIAERFYRELLLISGSKAHPGCPGPSANSTSTLQHCYSAAYHPPSPPSRSFCTHFAALTLPTPHPSAPTRTALTHSAEQCPTSTQSSVLRRWESSKWWHRARLQCGDPHPSLFAALSPQITKSDPQPQTLSKLRPFKPKWL